MCDCKCVVRIDNHISEQMKKGLFRSSGFLPRFSREKKGSRVHVFGSILCAVLMASAAECVMALVYF